jgi:hypothetical protein
MATTKDVRVKTRLNVLSDLLRDQGYPNHHPGKLGVQRKTIIDVPVVEIPSGELETRLEHAQLVLEYGYRVDTATIPPIVVTDEATIVSANAAIFNGHVNPNGESTAVRFEYNLDSRDLNGWVTCDETPVTGVTNQTVHKDMSDLDYDTVYYYRVRGVSAAGTYYGTVKSFKTGPTP